MSELNTQQEVMNDIDLSVGFELNQNVDNILEQGSNKLTLDLEALDDIELQTIEDQANALLQKADDIYSVRPQNMDIIKDTAVISTHVQLGSVIQKLDAESMSLIDDMNEIGSVDAMISSLTACGYLDVEALDYEQLLTLDERNTEISKPNAIVEATQQSILNYRKLDHSIKCALATEKSDLNKNKGADELNGIVPPADFPVDSTQTIYRDIQPLIANPELNQEQIVKEELQNLLNGPYKNCVQHDIAASVAYIASIVKVTQDTVDELSRLDRQVTRIKNRVVYCALKEHIKTTASILKAQEEGRLEFIKNFSMNNNRIYAICPICGEKFEITKQSLVECLIYLQQNSAVLSVARVPLKCPCGTSLILASSEYDLITQNLKDKLKGHLKNFENASADLSQGTTFSKYTPPTSWVFEAIDHLVIRDTNLQFETDEIITEESKEPLQKVNFDEYSKAVQIFNKKINMWHTPLVDTGEKSTGFDTTSRHKNYIDQANTLSLASVASFMCQTLSKSYQEYKVQAVCYFINELKSNPVLFNLIDNNRIIYYEELVRFLKDSEGFSEKTIPRNAITDILVATFGDAQDATIKLSDGRTLQADLDNPEYVRALLEKARTEVIPYYENLITKSKELQAKTVERITVLHEQFSLIKLGKRSNVLLSDLQSVVFNEATAQMVDKISDEIIINNLCEEFYSVWVGFDSDPLRSGAKIIKDGGNKRKDKIFKQLKDTIPETMATTYLPVFTNVFYSVPVNELEPLNKIANALKKQDVFAFYQEILRCPSVIQTTFSTHYKQVIFNTIVELKEYANKALGDFNYSDPNAYYNFYLRDFTKEELEHSTVDYTRCRFGRFVPHRLEGETIEQYLDRFEMLETSGSLNKINSIDYYEEFAKLTDDIPIISSWDGLYRMQYSTAFHALYIKSITDFCISYPDGEVAERILGISHVLLDYLNRVLYRPVLLSSVTNNAVFYFYSDELQKLGDLLRMEYDAALLTTDVDKEAQMASFDLEQLISDYLTGLPNDADLNGAVAEIGKARGI